MTGDKPLCDQSAGGQHDESPPAAVVQVIMEWETRAGEPMRRIKELCLPCYLDTAEEFRENATSGRHSLLVIQSRYSRAPAAVPPQGSHIGREEKGFRERWRAFNRRDNL